MKFKELKNLSHEELLSKLKECKEELFNLRFQFSINQLKNPMRIRQVRKDVARILTMLNSRKEGN